MNEKLSSEFAHGILVTFQKCLRIFQKNMIQRNF